MDFEHKKGYFKAILEENDAKIDRKCMKKYMKIHENEILQLSFGPYSKTVLIFDLLPL